MDALELLETDHRKVKELFEEAQAAEDAEEQKTVFKELRKELETHAHIEETVFYPAMQKQRELKDMVKESLEEHKRIKTLLPELDRLQSDSDEFEAKLMELQECVEHHAEEEEEGKMFPKIRALYDSAALDRLGKELEAAKQKYSRKAA